MAASQALLYSFEELGAELGASWRARDHSPVPPVAPFKTSTEQNRQGLREPHRLSGGWSFLSLPRAAGITGCGHWAQRQLVHSSTCLTLPSSLADPCAA